MPCPACQKPVSALEAADITLEAYDFGHTQYEYRCPTCGAELEQIVPFLAAGGALWHWHLKDSWLQEQLRNAQQFDRQKETDTES